MSRNEPPSDLGKRRFRLRAFARGTAYRAEASVEADFRSACRRRGGRGFGWTRCCRPPGRRRRRPKVPGNRHTEGSGPHSFSWAPQQCNYCPTRRRILSRNKTASRTDSASVSSIGKCPELRITVWTLRGNNFRRLAVFRRGKRRSAPPERKSAGGKADFGTLASFP